jgi:hypothetical protein
MDLLESLAHVEQYAFKPRDPMVNAPLAAHMAAEHPEHYALWVADDTIGDLEDQHYIAHGLLVSDAELQDMLGRGSR